MSILQGLLPNFLKPEKLHKNIYKKSAKQKLPDHRRWARGGPGASQAACWRGQALGRARRSPGWVPPPLVPSFGLYLESREETLADFLESRISPSFRRRSASEIGSVRRPLPGTLPEGGLTSGSFSTAMDASRTCRE